MRQKALFFLNDLLVPLGLSATMVARRARALARRGQNPYQVMGARRLWGRWVVRMTLFAPFYRRTFLPRPRTIEPAWDANDLLAQDGVFLLRDVCQRLPFSYRSLCYQVRRIPNSKETLGIWYQVYQRRLLLHMPTFARWISAIWCGSTQTQCQSKEDPVHETSTRTTHEVSQPVDGPAGGSAL